MVLPFARTSTVLYDRQVPLPWLLLLDCFEPNGSDGFCGSLFEAEYDLAGASAGMAREAGVLK